MKNRIYTITFINAGRPLATYRTYFEKEYKDMIFGSIKRVETGNLKKGPAATKGKIQLYYE